MKLKIRHALVIFNSLSIILTAVVIILLYMKSTRFSVYQICEKYMNEVLNSVKNSSESFFGSVESQNRDIAVHYWRNELMTAMEDEDTAFDYFRQIAQENEDLEMVYFADPSGGMVMARRMPDGTISKRVVKNDGEYVYEDFYHVNQMYNSTFPSSVKPDAEGYNPTRRAWYKAAIERKDISWTDVYFFATGNQPGFSCSMPVYRADGSLIGVSCIDVAVGGLSHFLSRFSLTPNAKLFILDKQGQIVAEPIETLDSLDTLFVVETDEKGDVTSRILRKISDAQDAMKTSYKLYKTHSDHQIDSFVSGGAKYLSLYQDFKTSGGLEISFGLIIPDKDVMGVVYKINLHIFLIAACFVILAIMLSVYISNVIAKPLNILSLEMDKIMTFSASNEPHVVTSIHEINGMINSFESMKKGLTNFQKYVPSELVNELIATNQLATVGGEKKNLSVFFSDIENFTSISESMDPVELVKQMNDYFSAISNTIIENSGTLDKYIGDAVMAFWGAPLDNKDHAICACKSAIICQELIFNLCHKWSREGKPIFRTRIGIHSGPVIVGNMGYEKRINYTVIGDGVNLASRLEGINKFYGTQIVISQDTYKLVSDKFHTRMLDRITVKGKTHPVHIYELLSEKGKLNRELVDFYALYENALTSYFSSEWDAAIRKFTTALSIKEDEPSRIMLDRCQEFKKNPPPQMWNGVHEFTKK